MRIVLCAAKASRNSKRVSSGRKLFINKIKTGKILFSFIVSNHLVIRIVSGFYLDYSLIIVIFTLPTSPSPYLVPSWNPRRLGCPQVTWGRAQKGFKSNGLPSNTLFWLEPVEGGIDKKKFHRQRPPVHMGRTQERPREIFSCHQELWI